MLAAAFRAVACIGAAASAIGQPPAGPGHDAAVLGHDRQVHASAPVPALERAAQLLRPFGRRGQDLDRELAREPLLEGGLPSLGVPPPGERHGKREHRQAAEDGKEDGERQAPGHRLSAGASCWRART